MDEQQTPSPTVNEPTVPAPQAIPSPVPQQQAPEPTPTVQPSLSSLTTPPTAPPKAKKGNVLYIVVGAILFVGIAVFGLLYAQSAAPTTSAPPVAVTPTQIPTPTPPPNVSRIATTTAFMAFKEEIASFSATLNSFSLQDSTLAPPILDLELNLSN